MLTPFSDPKVRTTYHKTATRKWKLKKKYGMTLEQYDELFAQQDGRCGACGEEERLEGPLSIDHDHTTGIVRGLLCRSCNLALGHAFDSPERLRQLITYLETTCS